MNRWWANDPDALMIRRNERMERGLRLTYGLLNEEEVKTSVINQFAGGGIMCQTEPLDRIDEDRLMEIRHLLPVAETEVHPMDLMAGERFPSEADVYIKKTGAHCVCIINWSDTEEKIPEVHLGALGLEPEGRYVACDFYSGTYRTGLTAEDTVVFPALKPHGATVIKVERIGERPVIIGSDGHYSMGAECTRLEIEGGALRVGRKALLPVDTHYRILLPEGWTAEQGKTVDVMLRAEEEEASIPLKLKK